jgi:acetyltransferase-like isoleucine patch superfamily enzyme
MNVISNEARIGKNVKFGNFVTVAAGASIGDDSIIESYSYIGYSNGRERGDLTIGKRAHVRSHTVIYQGSTIGDDLVTGHHAVIRENCQIGDAFQAGIATVLMGELEIGDYVKTGSSVEIGQGSRLGSFVWIYINTSLINDRRPPSAEISGPIVEDYAVIGAHCVIYPGVRVGTDSLVGSGCFLMQDLAPEQIAVGNPSKVIGPTSKIKVEIDGEKKSVYPWRFRFHKGYPKELVDTWLDEAHKAKMDGG